MFGLAKAAPFAAEEVSVTGKSQFCSGFQNLIGPAVEVVFGHLKGGYILASRLVDGHGHRIDVVDTVEQFQGAQGVTHHLGVVIRLHQNTKPMLIVDDMECSVGDNDGVRGTEALFHPSGEIHPLLNEDYRVRAGFLGSFRQFQDIGSVSVGAVFHFFVIPSQMLGRIDCLHAQRLAELVLTEAVSIGPFSGIIRAFVLVGFT